MKRIENEYRGDERAYFQIFYNEFQKDETVELEGVKFKQ